MDVLTELGMVERLLNTVDHEGGPDSLVRPSDLAEWLRAQGLYDGEARVSRTDLTRAVTLREAVRGAVGQPDDEAAAALVEACQPFPLAFGDPATSALVLTPSGAAAQAALGSIVVTIARSHVLGAWDRLKLCPGPSCGWAFVDRSRNRSRRWCEMRSCGNHAKVRAYRAKRRSHAPV
ncbi:MAG: CGNR zinc finger domain-containing protein [Actinomycetota bacterium]|nr:CGNR zinc finger domain-containing protein [Actinomycetota bacterium]